MAFSFLLSFFSPLFSPLCVKGLRAALIITMDVACYATLEPCCVCALAFSALLWQLLPHKNPRPTSSSSSTSYVGNKQNKSRTREAKWNGIEDTKQRKGEEKEMVITSRLYSHVCYSCTGPSAIGYCIYIYIYT